MQACMIDFWCQRLSVHLTSGREKWSCSSAELWANKVFATSNAGAGRERAGCKKAVLCFSSTSLPWTIDLKTS